MKFIFFLIFFLPISLNAQLEQKGNPSSEGINFMTGLKWGEIVKKAQSERKFIFLDCYTTWCGPCKVMERNVYQLEQVGFFFNTNFISVKVQMDRTEKDNAYVKSWYTDADSIASRYKVNAYPTYLFFNPDGTPVHSFVGGFPADKFIQNASDALDSLKQSYTLAAKYQPKKMELTELREAINKFKYSKPDFAETLIVEYVSRLKPTELSSEINRNLISLYKDIEQIHKIVNNYINSLSETELFFIYNILLISASLTTPQDPGFRFFLKNVSKIDSIVNDNNEYTNWWSTTKWVDGTIYSTDIRSYLLAAKANKSEPQWNTIGKSLRSKYPVTVSDRNLMAAKMSWYANKSEWKKYIKETITYVNKYGADLNELDLNNYAWKVFQYSDDAAELNIALSWSNRAITMNPASNWIDTYANLLYKLNRRNEAIRWEKVAIQITPGDISFKSNLEKMMTNRKTWL